MKLKRSDIQLGELLIGDYSVSLTLTRQIQKNYLYVVVDPIGQSDNGIWIVCVQTGEKFHANARYFRKTDNFCP